MKLFEKIFFSLAVVAFLLKLFHLPAGSLLLVLSSGILGCFYIYLGFALFNKIPLKNIFKKEAYKEISAKRIIFSVLSGFALAILIIGILFCLQHWPGAIFNLTVGLVSVLIPVLISIFKFTKTKSVFYKNLLIRLSIYEIIGILLFISKMDFIR